MYNEHMQPVIISAKQIREVTPKGLTYLDEDGNEALIDFAGCYEWQLSQFLEPKNLKNFQEINHLDANQLEQSIQRHKEWKVVADRNVIGMPIGTAPYIEFYTQPPIRFEFSAREEYWEIRNAVEKSGWRTHDRS